MNSMETMTSTCTIRMLFYLFQAESSMASSYPLPLLRRERVEHRVMRVDRWKTILGQLIINQINYLLHTTLVITPVTNNLKQGRVHNSIFIINHLQIHYQPQTGGRNHL